MLAWIFPENKRIFQGKDLFKRSHVLWVWGHRCFLLPDTVGLTLWSSRSCRFLLSLKAVRHGWCSQFLGAAGSDAKDLSVCTQNVQLSPPMSMEMEQLRAVTSSTHTAEDMCTETSQKETFIRRWGKLRWTSILTGSLLAPTGPFYPSFCHFSSSCSSLSTLMSLCCLVSHQ